MLLLAGCTQIIIREHFPELHPPWPLIGGALMVVLFGVVFVPPLIWFIREKRKAGTGRHDLHT